jgi:hypothetical protein
MQSIEICKVECAYHWSVELIYISPLFLSRLHDIDLAIRKWRLLFYISDHSFRCIAQRAIDSCKQRYAALEKARGGTKHDAIVTNPVQIISDG